MMSDEDVLAHAENEVSEVWLPAMKEHGVKRLSVGVTPNARSGGVVYRVTAHISGRGPITQKAFATSANVEWVYLQPAALRIRYTIYKFNVMCRLLDKRVSRWRREGDEHA